MALKGELSEFTVEQVLRLLELSGQTGTLDVRGTDMKATIEIASGAVSNVRRAADPETGLGRALLLREGTFTFRLGPVGERAIDLQLDELIVRSRAKAEEAIEIGKVIPDDAARFRLSERAMSGTAFTVGPDELKVLMEVSGGRSLREIRQRSRMKERTGALLYGLLQKGLVERTEAEADVAVQVVRPPRRSARRAARVPAESEGPASAPMPAQPVEIVPAASADMAADISPSDLSEELDVRLAALGALSRPEPGPEQAEAPADDAILVTPSVAPAAPGAGAGVAPEATVVFALHYMPATAQAAAEPPAAAPPPKRRGLFDLVLRRGSAASAGAAAQPELDVPSPADLASLANALHAEYGRQAEVMSQLGSHAERSTRAFEETLPARLTRVYALRAVGSRVPLRGDEIDVDAIRQGDIAPARILPYLALLIRDLRDEAIRAFGADDARATYAAAVEHIFGRQVLSPTMILRHADLPPRGRLRRQDGSGTAFELRDRTYVIGRAASCDVVVTDEKASSRHAQLAPDVLGFRLRDLGSTNGTYVNGERIPAERLLRGGESIRVGETTFLYERVTAAS